MTDSTEGAELATGDLELRDRAAAARCYECGSPEVLASCSECHRLMCDDHRGRRGPLSTVAAMRDRLNLRSRPVIDRGQALRLCGDCTRRVDLPRRVLIGGTVVFAVGLLLIPLASVAGSVVALVGAGVAGAAFSSFALRWRQLHRRLAQRLRLEPELPRSVPLIFFRRRRSSTTSSSTRSLP